MPDIVIPITSKQRVRIADLVAVAARNATELALERVILNLETAQTNIIAEGGNFQELLKPEFEKIIASALNKLSGCRHPVVYKIERFYKEVLGMMIDLTGVSFPEKTGFPTYMAVPLGLNEDIVLTRLAKYFGVGVYTWLTPVAEKINRKSAQQRPTGMYVYCHVGGDEPDAVHLNKSYDDATGEGMLFLNPLEYLLVTGSHMWEHHKWMDVKGATRTSSLWSDGCLVYGGFNPDDCWVYLSDGRRDYRNRVFGPRELFLG